MLSSRGLLITLEGGDGAGKTTQANLLYGYLAEQGLSCLLTREPGGTPIGERIRELLLDLRYTEMVAECESLLYAAARAQHVRQVILPALDEGRVVLCDRFVDSSLAYQGYGAGVNLGFLREVNRLATAGIVPHLTIVLDLDPVAGRQRGRIKDRIEHRDLVFHRRVRNGFLALAREEPQRMVVIPAEPPPEEVHRQVLAAVERLLERWAFRP